MTSGTLKTIGLLFSLVLARSIMEAQPAITSPAPGSQLPSSSATFQWTGGAGVAEYFLYVGSAKGASDIYSKNEGLNFSDTVTSLPTNGMTLYVRLWWLTADGWQSGDYTYTALGVITPLPAMISPAPGSQLSSSSATFQWTSGTQVMRYFLDVGSNLGATNLYSQNQGFGLSATVTGLPTNGMTLYVRLWWLTSAGWQSGDYTYAAPGVSTPVPAMISPKPGSRLHSSFTTFQWSGGQGMSSYFLYVGSTAGAFDIYSQNENLNVSATITNLPTDGRTLYVRLWWLTTAWNFSDYTYTASLNKPPALGVLHQGANIILSWPTNDPAFMLEYSTNQPPSVWIPDPTSPAIENGQFVVTNGASYPFIIYRLEK
jgi:serine protease